ncbi:hypothetical protein KEF85_04015 [Methylomonas paludis]|uniref:Uncharacterized protein n=1 Tax=Methylomonas paludis TaxID=1173101 RepID=A0A975MPI6_9GAMM|nr:hypothetical protein [Methylomonas paludis]QWF71653.1 hypothetical protein KEF85_04015 [Methylomonas paludis]
MTNITLPAAPKDVPTLQAPGARLARITAFSAAYAVSGTLIGLPLNG